MAEFTYPPLNPDPDPAPLSPTIPLNPPMVGESSPFDHVDGQNRDLILESIRTWIRTALLVWTSKWQDYLVYWLALVEAWLEGFITAAEAYITEHAVAGYSWRTTVTPINPAGTTNIVIVVPDPLRPLEIGDLVSDRTGGGNDFDAAIVDFGYARKLFVFPNPKHILRVARDLRIEVDVFETEYHVIRIQNMTIGPLQTLAQGKGNFLGIFWVYVPFFSK